MSRGSRLSPGEHQHLGRWVRGKEAEKEGPEGQSREPREESFQTSAGWAMGRQ